MRSAIGYPWTAKVETSIEVWSSSLPKSRASSESRRTSKVWKQLGQTISTDSNGSQPLGLTKDPTDSSPVALGSDVIRCAKGSGTHIRGRLWLRSPRTGQCGQSPASGRRPSFGRRVTFRLRSFHVEDLEPYGVCRVLILD